MSTLTSFKYKIIEFAPEQKMEKTFNELAKTVGNLAVSCPSALARY